MGSYYRCDGGLRNESSLEPLQIRGRQNLPVLLHAMPGPGLI